MIIYIFALQSSHLHIQQPFLFIYLFFFSVKAAHAKCRIY